MYAIEGFTVKNKKTALLHTYICLRIIFQRPLAFFLILYRKCLALIPEGPNPLKYIIGKAVKYYSTEISFCLWKVQYSVILWNLSLIEVHYKSMVIALLRQNIFTIDTLNPGFCMNIKILDKFKFCQINIYYVGNCA